MTGLLGSPTLRRWLPVIVLPPILLLDGLLSADGRPVDLLSVVFAYVAALPLVWRAELPFSAMAPLLVGVIVLVLWNCKPATTIDALPACNLFDLTPSRGRRQTVVAAVAV